MSELLRALNVGKTYGRGVAAVHVFQNLSLSVHSGESIAIVGASGVGKSTLLHLLGALDRPDTGTIHYQDKELTGRRELDLSQFRNECVGFIFQFHYLLPEFTALENAAMPLMMRGVKASEARAAAEEILNSVGLASRLTHRPSELSGGEQQRVAIARALVAKPSLILADEPTGNLDVDTGRVVIDVLLSEVSRKGAALIMATHNLELAAKAQRVFRMKAGSLSEERL